MSHHTGHTDPTGQTHPPGHTTSAPGHDDHGSGHDMDMMQMYFHTGTNEVILFEGWKTTNTGTFIASLIGIFLLALIYEALKFLREFLYEKTNTSLVPAEASAQGLLGGIKENVFKSYHLVQTLLHMVQLILSYFLMLIFMTYNVWLGLAITLGAGVGYLLFGWNKRSNADITEHCK